MKPKDNKMSILTIEKNAMIQITSDELDTYIKHIKNLKIEHDQYAVGSIDNPRHIVVAQNQKIIDYLTETFPLSKKEIKKIASCNMITLKEGY